MNAAGGTRSRVSVQGATHRVNLAVRASALPAPARHIMLTLSDIADYQTAEIPPRRAVSLAQLAVETGWSPATIKRNLTLLERQGWLTRIRATPAEQAAHIPTQYKLLVPAGAARAGSGPAAPESGGSHRAADGGSQGAAGPDPVAQPEPTPGSQGATAVAHGEPPYIEEDHQDHQGLPPDAPGAPAGKHAAADELAAAFWEHHRERTAQPFLAIRGILRTALANGLARDHVARAIDKLAREGRPITGASITIALNQLRANTPTAIGIPSEATRSGSHRPIGDVLAEQARY